MADVYLFRRWPLVHDLGHTATAIGASLFIWLVWPEYAMWWSFLIGCTILGTVAEFLDVYTGGIVVTHAQRVRILQSRISRYGYRPSPDNVKDWFQYQAGWLVPLAVLGEWPAFACLLALELAVNYVLVKKAVSW